MGKRGEGWWDGVWTASPKRHSHTSFKGDSSSFNGDLQSACSPLHFQNGGEAPREDSDKIIITGSRTVEEVEKGVRPAFSGTKGDHWPFARHKNQV